MIRLLFLLLPLIAHGQGNERWRLILPDSLIQAPIKDMRLALAYRRVQDKRVSLASWELAEKGKEVNALRASLSERKEAFAVLQEEADRCRSNYQDVQNERDEWKDKSRQLKGWALVGKCAVGVATLLLVTNTLQK